MAEPHVKADDQTQTSQTPLLNPTQQNNHHQQRQQEVRVGGGNEDLSQTLQWLEKLLTFLGFKQSCFLSLALSWTAFLVIGVLVPVLVLEFSNCSSCEKYQIKDFELQIVASQACLAAVSLLCLSHNLRKYGIRRFLFVDRHSGHMVRFRKDYINQISGSLRLLVWWALPCFILKTAREIVRVLCVNRGSWWLSAAILLALVISWTYVSTITLTASILFHLVCNLQAIHFDDYGKLLERESDVLVFIEEHIRLRYHLSKISHRFRIFLVLQFLVVTAAQIVTLFQTTGYRGMITFINGGDFAVSSIVQVVGIILCLHAATRISHRAQGIASLASRWHALVTCGSNDASQQRGSNNNMQNLEAVQALNSLELSYSESDLESLDYVAMPTHTQLVSYLSSYHRRQAFGRNYYTPFWFLAVMYLQTNPGGITIFGWTVDRALINTIFFIELSLVTFVLGKTIVFTSK
ncbi:hypothetical protein TorRG33x02_213760 [Trema orientale]|uniref:Uncharacterized protein n=1 Tax=Trema orientale TaxID=63057 RepID=A0A2P5EB83_TREOI|nr:hypothetical protein TorRG33x02_213760 [Trema orientale]